MSIIPIAFRRAARLAIVSAVLSLSACAAPGPVAAPPADGWTLIPSEDPSVIVVQRSISNGLVSIMCTGNDCETLLIGEQACELTESFPVLVNTALETTLTEGDCADADESDTGKTLTGLVLLSEPNLLLASIVLGDDASFAVPLIDGNIELYSVPMDGLRAILAPLLPGLFEMPEWLGDHPVEPLPEEQNTDQDLLI